MQIMRVFLQFFLDILAVGTYQLIKETNERIGSCTLYEIIVILFIIKKGRKTK